MRRSLQWLQPTGAYLWRMLSGMPLEAAPPADGGRPAPAYKRPPRDTVPQAASNPLAQIRWDYLELRAEWCGWRARRALGREFREVERQVLAEQDAGEA